MKEAYELSAEDIGQACTDYVGRKLGLAGPAPIPCTVILRTKGGEIWATVTLDREAVKK